jgi:hypothetical protein
MGSGSIFWEHHQPELVKPLQRTINVRPNFDNTFDIDVNAVADSGDKQKQQSVPGQRPRKARALETGRLPGQPGFEPENCVFALRMIQ